jgi:hypothetical protein
MKIYPTKLFNNHKFYIYKNNGQTLVLDLNDSVYTDDHNNLTVHKNNDVISILNEELKSLEYIKN